jgi:glycosyltransferase involved in cell wall biosynthesis
MRSPADEDPLLSTERPIAYLVNRYPEANMTFIWREIEALEALGTRICRFTIRRGETALPDAASRAEQDATRIITGRGIAGLVLASLRVLCTRPAAFSRSLWTACRLGWGSERGVILHLAYLAEACALLPWLKQCKARHLHAHFGTNSAMVALLCHGPTEFDRAVSINLEEKIRRAAFVVAVSEFGRGQLYRWCPLEHWPKIHVVACGLDRTFLEASLADPPPVARRLVCVGRLVKQKGHVILVEAARQLVAAGLDFELTLIGDGPLRADLERLIRQRGLDRVIRLAGWLSTDDVRRAIRGSRAMVVPSFAEGLPVVLMESLALRRPVITTTIAGIPELVAAGVNGWLVPPGSVEGLAGAMRDALTADPVLLARMGEAGRASVLRNHDGAAQASKLLALFDAADKVPASTTA